MNLKIQKLGIIRTKSSHFMSKIKLTTGIITKKLSPLHMVTATILSFAYATIIKRTTDVFNDNNNAIIETSITL